MSETGSDKILPLTVDQSDRVRYADLGEGMLVFQVIGRANHTGTPDLKKTVLMIADEYAAKESKYFFVFDMEFVATMDSTFMGAMAAFALRHKKETGKQMLLCNLNEHCLQLLSTLGLKHFVDMRSALPSDMSAEAWKKADPAKLSKVEITALMLEAHETLCALDSGNKVQFAGVVSFLKKSLDDQKQGNPDA